MESNGKTQSFSIHLYFFFLIGGGSFCVAFCHIATWISHKYTYILKKINPEYSLEGLMLKKKKKKKKKKDWCWAKIPILWPPDAKSLTHQKRPWCWESLKTGGEGHDRGWDDWMASLTQWAWVWANSGRWWRTGRPGVLQSMGSQTVGLNGAAKQEYTCLLVLEPPPTPPHPSRLSQSTDFKSCVKTANSYCLCYIR